MVEEGTPGKYSLWAVRPNSRTPIAESYATQGDVDKRRESLERAGYNVLVTLQQLRKSD